MIYFFYITLLFWLFIAAIQNFSKRHFFGLNAIVLIGIYLPMLLYSFKWSTYIDVVVTENFYLIFTYLNICMTIYNLFTIDDVLSVFITMPQKVNTALVLLSNSTFISLFLLENYLGSGHLFPTLSGIDIHTYSATGIAYITRSIFAFVFIDVMAYFATAKRRYLVYALAIIALPVVTRNMRVSSAITLFQMLLVFIAFRKSVKSERKCVESERNYLTDANSKRNYSKRFKIGIVAALLVISVTFVVYSASLTNTRSENHNIQYGISYTPYSQLIGYTGPSIGGEFSAIYYGYFPLSFNNLNLSLKYGHTNLNLMGYNSFPCLYFGILHLNHLTNINQYDVITVGRVSALKEATVATGFWNFFYDYDFLCFFPIATMIAICGAATRNLQRKNSVHAAFIYYATVPTVFFQSFQNVFFDYHVIYQLIIGMVLINLCFLRPKVEHEDRLSSLMPSTAFRK